MSIGLASEDPRPDENGSLVIRNVKIHGLRTSVRLEPQMWNPMIQICRCEFCTPDDVCSYVAERKSPRASLSSSLRVFMLDYFCESSAEDGHSSSGHGQSKFMSQQEDHWLMRDISTPRTTSFRTD
ncbi:MAG: ribbon-helix-helix domain-containing protein [Candidatus Binataceae bacterium]|jgi:predicted DNA-binding ribbon-helix-helix protein